MRRHLRLAIATLCLSLLLFWIALRHNLPKPSVEQDERKSADGPSSTSGQIELVQQDESTRLLELLNADHQLEALELIFELDSNSRQEWIPATLRKWAERSPEEASILATLLRDNDLLPQYFLPLAEGWAVSSPEDLASFASTLPQGEARSTGLDHAMQEWLRRDPQSAVEWVPSLSDPNEFDRYLFEYLRVTDTANRSSQIAANLAQRIQDKALRLQSLQRVMDEWMQTEPEAALQFLASSREIAPEQKELLLAFLVQTENLDSNEYQP